MQATRMRWQKQEEEQIRGLREKKTNEIVNVMFEIFEDT